MTMYSWIIPFSSSDVWAVSSESFCITRALQHLLCLLHCIFWYPAEHHLTLFSNPTNTLENSQCAQLRLFSALVLPEISVGSWEFCTVFSYLYFSCLIDFVGWLAASSLLMIQKIPTMLSFAGACSAAYCTDSCSHFPLLTLDVANYSS